MIPKTTEPKPAPAPGRGLSSSPAVAFAAAGAAAAAALFLVGCRPPGGSQPDGGGGGGGSGGGGGAGAAADPVLVAHRPGAEFALYIDYGGLRASGIHGRADGAFPSRYEEMMLHRPWVHELIRTFGLSEGDFRSFAVSVAEVEAAVVHNRPGDTQFAAALNISRYLAPERFPALLKARGVGVSRVDYQGVAIFNITPSVREMKKETAAAAADGGGADDGAGKAAGEGFRAWSLAVDAGAAASTLFAGRPAEVKAMVDARGGGAKPLPEAVAAAAPEGAERLHAWVSWSLSDPVRERWSTYSGAEPLGQDSGALAPLEVVGLGLVADEDRFRLGLTFGFADADQAERAKMYFDRSLLPLLHMGSEQRFQEVPAFIAGLGSRLVGASVVARAELTLEDLEFVDSIKPVEGKGGIDGAR